MSKLYAIRQTEKSNYWYDFVEDFTSDELNRDCISNNFTYVKECQNSLERLNPAWKNSKIVEFREMGELDDFEDLYYKSIEQRADLEAKLAELNKEPLNCSQIENGMSLCVIQKSKIAELKQQLAEKEKEIMELSSKVDLFESEKENLFRTLEEANEDYQDKISFAVERLEKVKELISDKVDENFGDICFYEIKEIFDNQIEQLKKENYNEEV